MSKEETSLRLRLAHRRRVMESTIESQASLQDTLASSSAETHIEDLENVPDETQDVVTKALPSSSTNTTPVPSFSSDVKSKKLDKWREKIRGRLQLATAKRENAAKLAELVTTVQEKEADFRRQLREAPVDPDEHINQTLLQRLKKRSLLKSRTSEDDSQEKDLIPSADEAYDFFTSTWDDDLQNPLSSQEVSPIRSESQKVSRRHHHEASPSSSSHRHSKQKKLSDQPIPSTSSAQQDISESDLGASDKEKGVDNEAEDATRDSESNGESTKLLISDLLKLEDRWQLVKFVPAIYHPFRERLTKEKEMYFIPSTTIVPFADKLPEAVLPRHLEEEGFYIGKPLEMNPRNRNKMEHRLINNKELQWFGEDGNILALPDSIIESPSRPQINETSELPVKTEYVKAQIIDSKKQSMNGTRQLDINIGHIVFTHHSLFSREHVLASKLILLYHQYRDRQGKSNTEFLKKKLEVLRSAVTSVQDSTGVFSSDEEGYASVRNSGMQRLQMYRKEVRLLRQRLDNEEKVDRTLLKNILQLWKSLKLLRERQAYTSTAVQLQILKKDVDYKTDKLNWQHAIDTEVQEEREDYEARLQELMVEYKCKLKIYQRAKSQRKKRKSLHKRKLNEEAEAGPLSQSMLEEENEADDNEDGHEMGKKMKIAKPQRPLSFDEPGVRERIQQKAMQVRRHPGEPLLYPELSYTASITAIELCPKQEQRRRNDVSKTKLFAKIYCNDKQVTQTAHKQLSADFTVAFGEMLNLCISQLPRSITLQLYEEFGLSKKVLAEILLPIPSENESDHNRSTLQEHEFSSNHVVTYSHEGVGSGIDCSQYFDDTLTETVATSIIFTSGIAFCRVLWTQDLEVAHVASLSAITNPPASIRDPISALGVTHILDTQKLKHWVETSDLDPNDPANAHLMCLIKEGALSLTNKNYFRLEQLQEEFNFVKNDDFFNSKRFKLIQQRAAGIPEFRNLRMIPLRDQDISPDIFKAYDHRLKEERLPPDWDSDDVDSYRLKVIQYLYKLREEVWKRYQTGRRHKELADIVSEEQIPDIISLGSTLIQLTEKKRPLRPVRKERKKVTAQNLGRSAIYILINVASAFNVPVRKEGEKQAKLALVRQPTTTSLTSPPQECPVRPLVEVTFQQKVVRTTISSGPNPCWNQDLQLEFRPPNDDLSPGNLQMVKDIIYFNLFDEVIVDLLEDSRDRDNLVHQRIEKRWLGTLQIPFSTLYLNTKIEGTFRISQTQLLGYTQDSEVRQMNLLGSKFNSLPVVKDHTYLSVFITLEPTLPLPEPLKEKFDSSESEKLLQRAEAFKTSFLESFPKREIKTLVIDINGRSVFITRFLRPLTPPQELCCDNESGDPENCLARVARFVALIPVLADVVVFPGSCDIWTTSNQFLKMMIGDQEEHAVLLCNYFLYLKKKAWLLLGFAVPEGKAIYVLTQDDLDYRLWNACTGDVFSVQDSFCPVQCVGAVINEDNIWVNVQPSCEPARMSFDIHNVKYWLPFFDSNFPNPGLASIQPERIQYIATDENFVKKLQEKVERTLRNQIMQWRKRFRTSWNRHCSQVLQKILSRMEESKFSSLAEEEIHSEMQTINSVYKVCGFTLCLPYSEMSAILDAVYATGAHLTEGHQLEFALAVHVHPYPNTVVAVWIYVASLHKR